MNWEALGSIAELISGIAVLITLIYLAIQIKQNTATAREAILRSQTDRNMDNSKFMAGTPGMMDIFIRAMEDPDAVTKEERWRFGSYMFAMFLDFQEAYHYHVSGRQDDYWWPTQRENIKVYLRRPGGQYWWHSEGSRFLDKRFIDYVNTELMPDIGADT